MHIEIIDWAKFNPRTDRANHSWFRFENKFFMKTFSWSPNAQKTFIYLCCVASQEGKHSIKLDMDLCCAMLKIKKTEIVNCLKELITAAAISQPSDVTMTSLLLTTYDTNVTNERTNILADSANLTVSFDFESLYKKYPRKEGKQKGIKFCQAQIKTSRDFHDLSWAIDRYAEHVKKSGTDSRYIKHFSTFMSSWRDWIDEETGKISEKEEPQWVKDAKAKEAAELEAMQDAV